MEAVSSMRWTLPEYPGGQRLCLRGQEVCRRVAAPLQCNLILTGFWGMFEVASARTRWQQAISEGLWPVQATCTA